MPTSLFIQKLRARRPLLVMEAHDAESAKIVADCAHGAKKYDAVWASGLTHTTCMGVPDTGAVYPSARAPRLLDMAGEPDALPIIYDGDSGGQKQRRNTMVEILDKANAPIITLEDNDVGESGIKQNSLGRKAGLQKQAKAETFAELIQRFTAIVPDGLVIAARMEGFCIRPMTEENQEEVLADALKRARLYRDAGAGALMVHTKSTDGADVLKFLERFRAEDIATPVIVAPTTYVNVGEEALREAGADIIIHTLYMMRAKMTAGLAYDKAFRTEHPDFTLPPSMEKILQETRNISYVMEALKKEAPPHESPLGEYLAGMEQAVDAKMRKICLQVLKDGKGEGAAKDILPIGELLDINTKVIVDPKVYNGEDAGPLLSVTHNSRTNARQANLR